MARIQPLDMDRSLERWSEVFAVLQVSNGPSAKLSTTTGAARGIVTDRCSLEVTRRGDMVGQGLDDDSKGERPKSELKNGRASRS